MLDADVADAIAAAADEVAEGTHDAHFPIDVFQTGSGTSSNMNANEVIATLATRALGRDVHPNDHVNASQSSNDTFPTTIHVAATEAVLSGRRSPRWSTSRRRIETRAAEWADVVKSGRTHLMDAVPITLRPGGRRVGRAGPVRRRAAASRPLPRLGELPIGGTAVGSGLNAPDGFGAAVVAGAGRR